MITCLEDPCTSWGKAHTALVVSRHSTSSPYCAFAITELFTNPKAIQNASRVPVVAGADGFYLSPAEFCHMKVYLEESLSFTKVTNGFSQSLFPTSLFTYIIGPPRGVSLQKNNDMSTLNFEILYCESLFQPRSSHLFTILHTISSTIFIP